MIPDFLLPSRNEEDSFPLIHFFLSKFQSEVEFIFESVSAYQKNIPTYIDSQWTIVASTTQSKDAELDAEKIQREWIDKTLKLTAAQKWLYLHQNALPLILEVEAEEIDISDPLVQPLWKQFIDQKSSQWFKQWDDFCVSAGLLEKDIFSPANHAYEST